MTADSSASASWSFANFSAVSSSNCELSSAVSPLDCGRYHRRRSLRDVLLWHELSPGTGPELCSPVKALIAALSGVAQPPSPQVLFLLEGSLSYNCACHLRLAESCIFFFFCFSQRCTWLLAVASELFCLHALCVVTCALSSEPFRRLPHAVCGLWLLLPQSSSLLHRLCVDGTLF